MVINIDKYKISSLFNINYKILFTLLLAVPSLIIASDMSDYFFWSLPADTNPSKQYLGMLFGANVGSVTLPTSMGGGVIVPNLIKLFNMLISIFGCAVVTYITFVSVINSSQEGEIMGREFSTVWLPLRAILGLLVMVPTSSGYSILQSAILTLVLNSIGAANSIWYQVSSYVAVGYSVYDTSSDDSTDGPGYTDMMDVDHFIILRKQAKGLAASIACINMMNYIVNNSGIASSTSTTSTDDYFVDTSNNDLFKQNPYFKYTSAYDSENGYTSYSFGTTATTTDTSGTTDIDYTYDKACGYFKLTDIDNTAVEENTTSADMNAHTIQKKVLDSLELIDKSTSDDSSTSISYYYPLTKNDWDTINSTRVEIFNSAISIIEDEIDMSGIITNIVSAYNHYQEKASKNLLTDYINYFIEQNSMLDDSYIYAILNSMYSYYKSLKASFDASYATVTAAETALENSDWSAAGAYYFNITQRSTAKSFTLKTDWLNLYNSTVLDGKKLLVVYPSTGTPDVIEISEQSQEIASILPKTTTASIMYIDLTENKTCNKTGSFCMPFNIYDTSGDPPASTDPNAGMYQLFTKYLTNSNNVQDDIYRIIALLSIYVLALDYMQDSSQYSSPAMQGSKLAVSCTPTGGTTTKWVSIGWPLKLPMPVPSFDHGCKNTDPKALSSGVGQAMLEWLLALFNNDGNVGDPLSRCAKMGYKMAQFAEKLILDSITGTIVTLMSLIGLSLVSPIMAMIVGLLSPIVLLALMITLMIGMFIWPLGIWMAFLIPIGPFLVYTAVVIGWVISVVEAMIGAPIIALSLMLPGDGRSPLGQAKSGIGILANLFLRPSIIIISYVFSIKIMAVGLQIYLNTISGFISFFNDLGGTPLVFGAFALGMVLIGGAQAIVTQSMTFMYTLPDQILKWIGVQEQGGAKELASNMQSTAEKRGNEGMKAGESTVGAAQKVEKVGSKIQAAVGHAGETRTTPKLPKPKPKP